MRYFICAALLAACDAGAARPYSPPNGPGLVLEASTGDSTSAPRWLDLGTFEPLADLPAETGTTGEPAPSTGDSTGPEVDASTGGTGSTSGPGSTGPGPEDTTSGTGSTGDPDTSTGESSSSTGEPPAICGDKVCAPSERAPCWAPGWCLGDCYQAPECASDCPCTPEAAAVKNFCNADPLPACPGTAPGGFCSQPDGDVQGFYSWHAKCG